LCKNCTCFYGLFFKDGTVQRINNNSIYSKSFGSSDGPKFITRVIPEYPVREKRLNIEGKVVLELVIDEDGHLISVSVLILFRLR